MLLLSENRESIESEDKFARNSIETHLNPGIQEVF